MNNNSNGPGHHMSAPSSVASGGASVRSSARRRAAAEEESYDIVGSIRAPTREISSPQLDINTEDMEDGRNSNDQVSAASISSPRRMSRASINMKGLSKMAIGVPEEDNLGNANEETLNMPSGHFEVEDTKTRVLKVQELD